MTAVHRIRAVAATGLVGVAGECALCDRSGALHFPDLQLLCISDLHLEKGSAFAIPSTMVGAPSACRSPFAKDWRR